MPNIDVLIPAYNEEQSIGLVVRDIPSELVREIVVINNNSTDNTSEIAKQAGATVIDQPQMGYGNACLKGISHLNSKTNKPDIVVFLDGDYSDYPHQMTEVVKPILEEDFDMVIGSRALGSKEGGAMMPQQIFGNWLATSLMKLLYNVSYSDLGPFRAIKYDALIDLEMCDKNYGWTVEMQVKAAKQKLKCTEVPVDYKKRIGVSKITGTIKGTVMAGYKILLTIFKYR